MLISSLFLFSVQEFSLNFLLLALGRQIAALAQSAEIVNPDIGATIQGEIIGTGAEGTTYVLSNFGIFTNGIDVEVTGEKNLLFSIRMPVNAYTYNKITKRNL